MTRRHLLCQLLAFVIFTMGQLFPSVSRAQAVEPVITQDYFIQQAVEEDLLITISAFEAEFQSRVTGSNDEVC